MHTIDHTYLDTLTAARHEALRTLIDLLRAAIDPLERRRLAAAILRIPIPRPLSSRTRSVSDEASPAPTHKPAPAPQPPRPTQPTQPAQPAHRAPSPPSLLSHSLSRSSPLLPPSSPSHPVIAHIINALIASKTPTITPLDPHTFNAKDPP